MDEYKELEKKAGIDLITYFNLFQCGFYSYAERVLHREPYIYKVEPRDFIYDENQRAVIVYFEGTDDVYQILPMKKYGKTWSLKKEDIE